MEQKIIDLLSGLETAITNLAPQAWNALVLGARVDSVVSIIGCIAISCYLRWYFRGFGKAIKSASENDDDMASARLIIGGIIAVPLTITMFITLFSSGMWLGLFSPETQVIRDLLEAAK